MRSDFSKSQLNVLSYALFQNFFASHKQDYRPLGSEARAALSDITLPSAPNQNGIQAMTNIGDFIDQKDIRNQ